VGVATVINRHTGLVSVEEPSLRAGKTDLVLPVPTGTTDVSGVGIVEIREKTGSFLKVVAAVARQTVSVRVRTGALIRNRNALLFGIEEPSLRAGKTNLVVPVPSSTSTIRRLGVIERRENTSSILKIVALEASQAVSISI